MSLKSIQHLEAQIQQVAFYKEPCILCKETYLFQQKPHTVERVSQEHPAFRGTNTAGSFLQRALYIVQRGLYSDQSLTQWKEDLKWNQDFEAQIHNVLFTKSPVCCAKRPIYSNMSPAQYNTGLKYIQNLEVQIQQVSSYKEPCISFTQSLPEWPIFSNKSPTEWKEGLKWNQHWEALIQQVPFYKEPCILCKEAYPFQQEPHKVQHKSQMLPALRGANTAGTFWQRALYTLQRGLSIPTRAPHSATQVSNTSRI